MAPVLDSRICSNINLLRSLEASILKVCVIAFRIQSNVFWSLLAAQRLANEGKVATVLWLETHEDFVLLCGPPCGRYVVWNVLVLVVGLDHLLDVARSVHRHALLGALLVLNLELALSPFDSAHLALGRRNDVGRLEIRLAGL